jgi:hypothetical protein
LNIDGDESYIKTLNIIMESLRQKKMLAIEYAYYEEKTEDTKPNQIKIDNNKLIIPVYFDRYHKILYAYLKNNEIKRKKIKYQSSEHELKGISIFTIQGAKITDIPISDEPEKILDIKRKEFKNSHERSEFIMTDILGNIAKAPENRFEVILYLNHIARAKLLTMSADFSSYIKLRNNHPSCTYPFSLKIHLMHIDKITGFIFDNMSHVKVVGNKFFIKKLKQYFELRKLIQCV